MRYLIQITRVSASDRPSEAIIASDSQKVLDRAGGVSQGLNEDNFFVLEATGNAELALQLIKVVVLMPNSEFNLSANNGFEIVAYPYRNITDDTFLRVNGKFELHYEKDNDAGIITLPTYAEGIQWIADNLGPSDGYVVVDEIDPIIPKEDISGPRSKVLHARPSLWPNDGDSVIFMIKNKHGRTDRDRA